MKFAIWGTGGMARAIRQSALLSLAAETGKAAGDIDLVFVDEDEDRRLAPINGCRVISPEQLFKQRDRRANISFAQANLRREIAEQCRERGIGFFDIRDPTHRCFDEVQIGEGVIFAANSLITSNVSIGQHFHCNIYSYVEHDCEIGDFVTFAPRASCNGNVRILDGAYIGSGAVIKQGKFRQPLIIGRNAVIGMGAVVTKDVGEGETVTGVPARPFRPQTE